jgi:hypothetical protein
MVTWNSGSLNESPEACDSDTIFIKKSPSPLYLIYIYIVKMLCTRNLDFWALRTDNDIVSKLIPPDLEPLGVVSHDISNTSIVHSVKRELQDGRYCDIGFHGPKSDSNGTKMVWLEYVYPRCHWMKPTFRHDNSRYLREQETWLVV